MAKGFNIDEFYRNLSAKEKREVNNTLSDNGIKTYKDFINAFNEMFGDGGGSGFSDSREKGLFGKIADQKSEYKEAERLLKSLEEFKKGGIDGMTHKEDAELLHEMGLDLDNMEESSRELAKNLKDVKFDNNFANRVQTLNRGFKDISSSIRNMGQEIGDILEPWEKADKAASKYAKNVAMSAYGMKAMTKNTIDNVVNSHIGINYNIGTDELIEAQQKYIQSVGRGLSIDNTQQESLAAMTAVMGDKSTELAAAFENFGVNLNATADHSGKMFDKASKTGISFEKLTDNVAKNIKIAQNYTFKNGLKGLESMAAKAVALKMDMAQVAALADKVSSVEGSIDVASKLQVLGGPFASMADPLGMMNEGLNDMEGLMDRVTKMVGGLGNFNKSTGEVEVSSFNKKRVQAAAQAMGISYDQLMESVNAQAKRGEIEKQIGASANAKGLSEDMQELLKNSATFDKNGKAGVSINGEFKTLDQLKDSDYEELVKQTQSESDDIKDIAKMLRSFFEKKEGTKKQKEANQAQMTRGLGESASELVDIVGQTNWLLKGIVIAQMAGSAMNMLGNGTDIVRTFRGGGRGRGLRGLTRNKAPRASEIIGNATRRIDKTRLGRGLRILMKNKPEKAPEFIGKTTKIGKTRGVKALRKVKQIKNLIKAGKGAKVLASVAKGAGKKIPIVGGLISAGLSAFENKDKFKDRSTRGSAIGKTAGAGVGAVLGGAVGTLLGPLGSIAGAAVGEWVGKHIGGFIGGIQDKRVTKNRAIVDNQLKEYGIERKGDYSVRNLKKINKALQNGELSDKMRKKLLEQGDTDLVKQIDAKKYEIEEKEEAKKDRVAQRKAMMKGENGEKAVRRIKNANFIVGNAYFEGKLFGKNSVETKLNNIGPELTSLDKTKLKFKTSAPKHLNPLGPLNPIGSLLNPFNTISLIKGVSENGFNAETLKMQKNAEKRSSEKSVSENPVFNGGKIDVNISGTIKLESNGKVFNMDELMNNGGFKQQLADLIEKQIKRNSNQNTYNDRQ